MQDQAEFSSDALQKELAKWQARVPKLAGALKEKTQQLESLRAELDAQLGRPSGNVRDQNPGIRARDALIEELEAKVKALSGRHRDAEGQLQARVMEIAGLRQEAADWRDQWQATTAILDQQAAACEQKNSELERQRREVEELLTAQEPLRARIKQQDLELTALREKCGSLESRNEKLFETTELANRQIETLGDNLDHLRHELRQKNEALAGQDAQAAGSVREVEELREQLAGRDRDIELLQAQVEEQRAQLETLDAELADRAGQAEEARAEARRLEECVANAEVTSGRWEAERRELSQQLDELGKRSEHLKSQLAERSDLLVRLEEDKSAVSDRAAALEEETARLSQALEMARRHSAESDAYVVQLDARLERQKQLMQSLEEEFVQVRENHAEAVNAQQRELTDKSNEIAALKQRSREHQETIGGLTRELEQKRDDPGRQALAEQVERLESQLRRQSKAAAEAEEAAAQARDLLEALESQQSQVQDDLAEENMVLRAEVVKLERMVRERTSQLNNLRWQQDMFEKQVADGTEGRILVVLNQQLISAREENARLLDRLRELESAHQLTDDLAKIRGIGPKLVRELNEQGIERLDQIATLSAADLDDEQHPLHAFKRRILKDRWIEQATSLIS